MEFDEKALQKNELLGLKLRTLYTANGYTPYHMSKFEEYDFYARNKDFLLSDNVITFTDTTGKLMALKPDVTLSIIKNTPPVTSGCERVCYHESVYRVSSGTGAFGEVWQTGLECIGNVSAEEEAEVVRLAVESLAAIGRRYVLDISDLSVLGDVIKLCGITDEASFFAAASAKNPALLDRVLEECGADEHARDIAKRVLALHGRADEVKETLSAMVYELPSVAPFLYVLDRVADKSAVHIDFSVDTDTVYYNGIVFRGFVEGVPQPVLSGGRYDNLLSKMRRGEKAVGFAVYHDALESGGTDSGVISPDDGFLNVALPKGRLGEQIYGLFEQAGFACPSIRDPGRRLIFENKEAGVRYFWVKPSDVAIYVERGAADIGVAGKDILLEYEPDVYELLDTGKGVCRMAVAAKNGFVEDKSRALKVATKFTNIARTYYRSLGRDIDIIHLSGSIELAPILGLSDVIVDIVETGATLKENDLGVVADVVPISARLIANKSSFKFKSDRIERLTDALTHMPAREKQTEE